MQVYVETTIIIIPILVYETHAHTHTGDAYTTHSQLANMNHACMEDFKNLVCYNTLKSILLRAFQTTVV